MRGDLDAIATLARSAGALAREHAGRSRRQTKTHATTSAEPVTEIDRACQRLIVAGLQQRFPDDGLIGEEDDAGGGITAIRLDAPRIWVIDPIDGTNNFVAGFGAFAVSIGLLRDGMPVLGAVYDVTRDLLHAGGAGLGAWAGSQPVQVRGEAPDESSLLMLTSNPLDRAGRLPGWVSRWFSDGPWKLRMLGSAALEAVQVSAGLAHASVTPNGKLWDFVGASAIVLEAGGVISDPLGRPVWPFDVRGYAGAKVPFIAATPTALPLILADIAAAS